MSITYTYESITMYFYELQVICTIDVTKVEYSCERNEVFENCLLSFFSSRCLLLTLMKALQCIERMKGSLYFRYNLSKPQL